MTRERNCPTNGRNIQTDIKNGLTRKGISLHHTDHQTIIIHVSGSIGMKKNVGTADKIIRTVLAIVFGILILTGQVEGTAAIVLGILAVILLLTSMVGTCPLYLASRISTRKDVTQK